MKTTALAIFSTIALGTPAAFAQNAADTTREIQAQTTITRGHIDNLTQKLNDQRVDSTFRASDYHAQSGDFRNQVDVAMKKFEAKLEGEILKEAGFWMDQYNAVYRSPTFSEQQKNVLLKERLVHLKAQFERITEKYKDTLKEVYKLVPATSLQAKLTFSPNLIEYKADKNFSTSVAVSIGSENAPSVATTKYTVEKHESPKFNHHNGLKFTNSKEEITTGYRYALFCGTDYYGVNVICKKRTFSSGTYAVIQVKLNELMSPTNFPALEKEYFQKVILPTFKGSCQSLVCLGLRSGDQLTLVSMIKSLLDRDIVLRLADGNAVKIDSLNLNIDGAVKELSRGDYPGNLPFDI